MDQLTRIENLLERIAVALEKHGEPVHVPFPDATRIYGPCTPDPKDWQWTGPTANGRWYGPCEPPKPEDFTILDKGEDVLSKEDAPKGTEHIRQRFGVDYSMMGDQCRVPDRCEARFDTMMNFGMEPHIPDDRHLTKEEAHALNRAVKRSTIKAHDGKLEKD